VFQVYILRSLRNGHLYVGITNDLPRRIGRHNEGTGGRFTRAQGPWELRYCEEHPDRSSATRRECLLKSAAGRQEKMRLAGTSPE